MRESVPGSSVKRSCEAGHGLVRRRLFGGFLGEDQIGAGGALGAQCGSASSAACRRPNASRASSTGRVSRPTSVSR